MLCMLSNAAVLREVMQSEARGHGQRGGSGSGGAATAAAPAYAAAMAAANDSPLHW